MAVGLPLSPVQLVTDAIHCGSVSFCLSATPPCISAISKVSSRPFA